MACLEFFKRQLKNQFRQLHPFKRSGITGTQAAANVLAHTEPDSIILMHFADGRGESLKDTVKALPFIIQTLHQEGYTFKTVPELINIPPYR